MSQMHTGHFELNLWHALRMHKRKPSPPAPFGYAVRPDLFQAVREDSFLTPCRGEFVSGTVYGVELVPMPLQVTPAIAFFRGNEDLWRRYVAGEVPEKCLLECWGKWFRSSRMPGHAPPVFV